MGEIYETNYEGFNFLRGQKTDIIAHLAFVIRQSQNAQVVEGLQPATPIFFQHLPEGSENQI